MAKKNTWVISSLGGAPMKNFRSPTARGNQKRVPEKVQPHKRATVL